MIKDAAAGLMHLFCRECASSVLSLPLSPAGRAPSLRAFLPPLRAAKADDKFQPGDIVASNLIVVRLAERQSD